MTRLIRKRHVILDRSVVPKMCHEVVEHVRWKFILGLSESRSIFHDFTLKYERIFVDGVQTLASAAEPVIVAVNETRLRFSTGVEHCIVLSSSRLKMEKKSACLNHLHYYYY